MVVYVDDTDAAIQYGGGWTASNSAEIFEGYGFPLYGTLHGANDTATFSFSFSGTYVAVFLLRRSGILSYNCTIDGMAFSLVITSLPVLSSSELANLSPADMATCYGSLSNDGKSHELQVTVFGSKSNPIFFDYLQYSPTETIASGDFGFPPGDPSVVLGPTNPDTLGLLPGSTLDFTFVGFSATVRGAFDSKTFSHTPSPVSYTIDGGSPINFTISNTATNTTPLLNNQLLIQTPRYPFGKHILHVDFLGTNDTVPFVPTDFVVQNQTSHIDLAPIPSATAPPTSILSTSTSSSRSAPTSSTSGISRSSNHSVILGTALGTVTLISILLLAIVLVRRKTREPGVYVPHDLLQETTVHPFSHETAPGQRRIGKTTSRTRNGTSNSGNRGTSRSPARKTVVHVDSGARLPQPRPQSEMRVEVEELPPTYETINHHGS